MNYSAVLFDLDGTLLDTLDDIADAGNAALAAYHFPTHPVSAYRHFVGEGVPNLIARIVPPNHQNQPMLSAVATAYGSEYQKRWNAKSRLYPGISEMLDELTRCRIRMAILSNKPQDFTSQCVDAFLSRWHFEAVAGAKVNVPRKPHPAAAIKIAETLTIPAAEFLYLGDTNTDMQTAIAAKMYPVGVLWGFRDRPELESAGAKTIIAHPQDLLSAIAL